MYRRILVACLAAIGALLYLIVDAGAQPKLDGKPKPNQGREIYVIVKARLYEVDEAFHNKVAKGRWLSKADLEELETKPQDGKLFARLEKQKPFLAGKKIDIDPGKEGVLLTASRSIKCLPTPDRLRQGKKDPQTIDEGFTLSAQVHISADRRLEEGPLADRRDHAADLHRGRRTRASPSAPKVSRQALLRPRLALPGEPAEPAGPATPSRVARSRLAGR
jgi:hypothetical protein